VADSTGAAPRSLIGVLFGFGGPVDRRTYLAAGILLMAFKYAAETVVVHAVTGELWTPLDYLNPQLKSRFGFRPPFLFPFGQPVPTWLPWALVLWTLPFIWIGVSMSVRRAADAGLSPWLGLFFFVPYANYALMLVLALVPTQPRPDPAKLPRRTRPSAKGQPLGTAVACAAAGVGAGLLMIAVPTYVTRTYGTYVFVGAPLVFGCLTAFLLNSGAAVSWRRTCGVVLAALVVLGLLVVTFAIEGFVCVCMALPIAAPLALLGAAVGRFIRIECAGGPRQAFLAAIAVPALAILDRPPKPVVHEVRSSIEIDAPPAAIWPHLLGFEEIAEPPEWPFRIGIACPQRARVRRCEFSTGAFVEPITVWDPPRRLAFDVAEQPPPMIEWSPWDIHPPHLDGFLRARRGEFRLVELPGGRTRLEGSTWYTLDIHPGPYWRLHADFLLGAIHDRVLRHVRKLAERH
jgi:uncharacterized membrane protein YhaH (DUF805 family)